MCENGENTKVRSRKHSRETFVADTENTCLAQNTERSVEATRFHGMFTTGALLCFRNGSIPN